MELGENRKKKSVSDFNFRSSMFLGEINKKKDEIKAGLDNDRIALRPFSISCQACCLRWMIQNLQFFYSEKQYDD